MDLNLEYAAHQRAIMGARAAANANDRSMKLEEASEIASRISVYQHGLGAAASCAWSKAQFALSAKAKPS